MFARAQRKANLSLRQSERRLKQLDYLCDEKLTRALSDLPLQIINLFDSVTSMPHLDSLATEPLLGPSLVDPTKRPWETGKVGYQNWAVHELIKRTTNMRYENNDSNNFDSAVESLRSQMSIIGEAEDIRKVVETLKEDIKKKGGDVEGDEAMDVS